MTDYIRREDAAGKNGGDETTQIVDGCCTACGGFMDCYEAADYKFCPHCGKRVGGTPE